MRTRRETYEEALAAGWPPVRAAMEAAKEAGARHHWRVLATIREAVARWGGDEEDIAALQRLLDATADEQSQDSLLDVLKQVQVEDLRAAWIGLVLDLGGIGGRGGYGGDATARLLPALGKGRWQASDGEAYRAAAEAARRHLEWALWRAGAEESVDRHLVDWVRFAADPGEAQWAVAHCLRAVEAAVDPAEAQKWAEVLDQIGQHLVESGEDNDALSLLDRWGR